MQESISRHKVLTVVVSVAVLFFAATWLLLGSLGGGSTDVHDHDSPVVTVQVP